MLRWRSCQILALYLTIGDQEWAACITRAGVVVGRHGADLAVIDLHWLLHKKQLQLDTPSTGWVHKAALYCLFCADAQRLSA